MPKRDWHLLIEDIIASINNIIKYIDKIEFDGFVQNQMLIDAVVPKLFWLVL